MKLKMKNFSRVTGLILTLVMAGIIFSSNAMAGDSCPSSIMGIHGVIEWDGYGIPSDFNGNLNHILYYDYKNPDTSLVDSTSPGCQKFEDVVETYGEPYFSSYLTPGFQWANNNTCVTISGCGPRDDDGLILADDRVVFVVYSTTQTAPYSSRILVDSVAYDQTNARFGFDTSAGYAVNHSMLNLAAPQVLSYTSADSTTFVVVQIQEPSFDIAGFNGGLYGDDVNVAGKLIAGYKVVAMVNASMPANGLIGAGNWDMAIDDDDRYIPVAANPTGATLTSQEITLNSGDANNLYVAYAPIFNYASGCALSTCTVDELKTLDSLGGSLNNSLTSRIASAAAPLVYQEPAPDPDPEPEPTPDPDPVPDPDPTPDPDPDPVPDPDPTPVPPAFATVDVHVSGKMADLRWTTSSEEGASGFLTYASKGGKWKPVSGMQIPVAGVGSQYSEIFKVKKYKMFRVDMVDANGAVIASTTTQLH